MIGSRLGACQHLLGRCPTKNFHQRISGAPFIAFRMFDRLTLSFWRRWKFHQFDPLNTKIEIITYGRIKSIGVLQRGRRLSFLRRLRFHSFLSPQKSGSTWRFYWNITVHSVACWLAVLALKCEQLRGKVLKCGVPRFSDFDFWRLLGSHMKCFIYGRFPGTFLHVLYVQVYPY